MRSAARPGTGTAADMDLGIAGRRALVCGASRGLGYACAEALAREGVEVTLASRNGEALAIAASRIEASAGRAVGTAVADISSEVGRGRALAACPEPDILVSNAGGPPGGDFRDLTLDQWSSALDANFLSAVELIRATVDGMAKRGFGRIVRMPVPQLDLSNATRLALTGYVAGVARRIAPQDRQILQRSFRE